MTTPARDATSEGIHGIDVSSRGPDKLDRDALHFALDALNFDAPQINVEAPEPAAIDLGCGQGAQSLRLAAIGWRVWMYDLVDLQEPIDRANALFDGRLAYVRKDVRRLSRDDFPAAALLLYSQRFLHHLTYADACDVMRLATEALTHGARAFLSASGLHGELGADYPHADRPIRARFAKLAPEIAARRQILESVCLYEEADLGVLAAQAGLKTLSITRTPFGNIKGVFEKP